MATKEQVEMVFKKLESANPDNFFGQVNEVCVGIGAVLRLLYESNAAVTAGKISEVLNISTARVAVLLKKMVAKGLITKERSANDARVTVVRLSELGEQTILKMHDEMFQQMSQVIDKVGVERVLEFIALANEIKDAIKAPEFDF